MALPQARRVPHSWHRRAAPPKAPLCAASRLRCHRLTPPWQRSAAQTAALAFDGTLEVPYSDGGRAWYDAFEADVTPIAAVPGEARRTRSLAASVDALCAALTALVARGGWRFAQLHLFGFSDGGTVRFRSCASLSAQQPRANGARLHKTPRGGSPMPPWRAAGATAEAYSCGSVGDVNGRCLLKREGHLFQAPSPHLSFGCTRATPN